METEPQTAPSVVSVVVVHEPGDWFDETLVAYAQQDYPNLRCLFLITGEDEARATELSATIRAAIPTAFVRVVQGNPGYGPAANEVLRLVEGDNGFFLLSHDDVAPARDAISTMVDELYRSNAGIVGPKLVEWYDPRRLQHVGLGLDRFGEVDPIVEPGEVDQEQHDAVRDVFVVPSAFMLVRADLFRELGGFDPAISFHGDDVELCWRAHFTGARVVVAPDARVRHLEALEQRRPDLPHRQLRARHRMRSVSTLTGASRLFGRSVQMVLLTLGELVVGLFTGRFGEATSSLRALGGMIPRTPSLIARRRAIASQRAVPERELLGLQVRGSARLASYLRGRETTTYVGVGTTVRRWREVSYGPVLAWFLLIVAVVIGSRSFFDDGVPPVGEFLPFPDSSSDLLRRAWSGWDARGFGSTSATPTGWITLAAAGVLTLFRMGLLQTLSIVGLFLVGVMGAWRLAAVFPVTRARVATMVVYAATPFVPSVLGTGSWSVLAVYAALPWMVHLLRRALGIETADPETAEIDLVDGIAPISLRERLRHAAALTLVLALTAAFVPIVIVLWVVTGLLLTLATLAARGAWRDSLWFVACTAGSSVAAFVLNLPWATTWTWSLLTGPAGDAHADGLVDLATLSLDSRDFSVLALALYVPVVTAVAITRAWRLTWAVRAAALVFGFGALAILADRGALPFAAPEPGLLLAPVVLGVAISAGAIAGGFGLDVRGRGFGWRQPLAVLSNAAIVLGLVPAITAIGDGAWGAPSTPLSTVLAAQLPHDPADGDYRTLYVGDPRVLPVPGKDYRDGIAFAVVDDGPLGFEDRWPVPDNELDAAVTDALDHIADGATLRAGRLLAPLGIRYVVVPITDGAQSTVSDPLPVPAGLVAALGTQLDIGETFGPPSLDVYVNRSWMPTAAVLTGPTAEASRTAGDEALVRADLTARAPLVTGWDPLAATAADVDGGVVHLAVPFDERWELELDGQPVDARPSFGLGTGFDVAAPGTATLSYAGSAARPVILVVQVALWLAVVVLASRARSPFGRRRSFELTDETLIDLDAEADDDDPPLDHNDDPPLDAPAARGATP